MSDNFYSEFIKFLKKYPIQSCALVLVICFLLGDKFEKNFAALGSVGSLFIGYAAYQISREQHRATEQKISDLERKIILENYLKLKKAVELVFRHGQATDESAKMIWEVEEEANLFAGEELKKFITRIREYGIRDYSESGLRKPEKEGGLESGEGRERLFENNLEFIKSISYPNFQPEKIYSKYLKLPNPKP